MLRALAREDGAVDELDVVQVDERVAPPETPDRNLAHLHESLLEHTPLRAEAVHAMPVECGRPRCRGDEVRSELLREIAGAPPVLDLVHLGLGADGHTASLVPGDPVLDVIDADVAVTGIYQGRRRMTLTYPMLNRARRVLWVVTGAEKAEMLRAVARRRSSIPAGRIRREQALVLADSRRRQDCRALDLRRGGATCEWGSQPTTAGLRLKEDLIAHLRAAGHEIIDFGAHALNPGDDYPGLRHSARRRPSRRGRWSAVWRSAAAASARRSAPTRSQECAPVSSTITSRPSKESRTTT